MNSILGKLATMLIKLMNWLTPKSGDLWVFESHPDFVGNSRVFFDYLRTKEIRLRLVWFVQSSEAAETLRKQGVEAIPRHSLAAWWTFIRADTFVLTHGRFDSPRVARQRVINFSHGMPLKSIENFLPSRLRHQALVKRQLRTASRDLMVATSGLTRALLAAAFDLPPRQVVVNGQPRTDRLFEVSEEAQRWLSFKTGTIPGNKYIFMLPTYRQGGRILDGQKIFHVFDDERGWSELHKVLESAAAHAFIKLHPSEPDCVTPPSNLNRIHLVTDNELFHGGLDLYDLLGAADVLVTDYSSVYIDFLMLNRPIVFFAPDRAEYGEIRNFLIEPYEFWTPGPKVDRISDLALELGELLGGRDRYNKHREQLLPIFHTFVDGNASARIASMLALKPLLPTSLGVQREVGW